MTKKFNTAEEYIKYSQENELNAFGMILTDSDPSKITQEYLDEINDLYENNFYEIPVVLNEGEEFIEDVDAYFDKINEEKNKQ